MARPARALPNSSGACRGQDPDHRADRMTDEDGVAQTELPAELDDVVGIPFERA